MSNQMPLFDFIMSSGLFSHSVKFAASLTDLAEGASKRNSPGLRSADELSASSSRPLFLEETAPVARRLDDFLFDALFSAVASFGLFAGTSRFSGCRTPENRPGTLAFGGREVKFFIKN